MAVYRKYLVVVFMLCATLLPVTIACETVREEEEARRQAGRESVPGNRSVSAEPKSCIEFGKRNGETGSAITAEAATVKAHYGELAGVRMVDSAGKLIVGTLSADRRAWKPDSDLKLGTNYTVTADTRDTARGARCTMSRTFTTVTPERSTVATYTPEGGTTVGVGMPVSIVFDKPVLDRDAVLSHITVRSNYGQEAVGHWFGERRLVLRPREYWKPHSQITLVLDLADVVTAPAIKGIQKKTVRFATGGARISYVNVRDHRMDITRDGKFIKSLPVTAGALGSPTYNGVFVISAKYPVVRMNGATVGFPQGGESGYDISDVPHAMRLTDSGTFIHGNYWSPVGSFGSVNTTHGCIGLQDSQGGNDPHMPASWFYHYSQPGDIIAVTGSNAKTVVPDNGLSFWNMDWPTWTAPSREL